MNHLDTFAGIGGFSLAARWMGWHTVAWVEKNPFCQRVLKYHFPRAIGHEDITTTDFRIYRGYIDILTGGWPCQKYSIAGSRVWNEPLKEHLIRAIRESEPGTAVLENVGNFLSDQFADEHNNLCECLESMGYEVQTFDIDAASCGLSTVERHIWIVATSDRIRQKRGVTKAVQGKPAFKGEFQGSNQGDFKGWDVPEARVCDLGKGFPYGLADISLSKWHGESIQAIGNAIVPQVALQIFKAIEAYSEQR